MKKCDAYRIREATRYLYSKYTGEVVKTYKVKVPYCIGTQECTDCFCNGNEAKCTFYNLKETHKRKTHKRKHAHSSDKS